jgi:hypothetical protein
MRGRRYIDEFMADTTIDNIIRALTPSSQKLKERAAARTCIVARSCVPHSNSLISCFRAAFAHRRGASRQRQRCAVIG